MARDTRKTLKKGGNEKRKVKEKLNNVTTTIKSYTLIFVLNIMRENVVNTITFHPITFFSVAGYLKRSNEISTSIYIYIGLVDMDYFFQMSEKYFQFRK